MPEGATGGVIADGRLHGKHAAEIILKLAQGKNIDEISYKDSDHQSTIINFQEIGRYNLENISEKITLYNKPTDLFYTHRFLVIGIITLSFLLSVVILVLIINLFRQKKSYSSSRD